VICVNDGSTDGTVNILKRWQNEKKLNLRIIDKPNGGVSSARNAGIAAAQGKYMMFCDADDLFHPEMAQRIISAMEDKEADTAYCLLSRSRKQVEECALPEGTAMKDQQQAMHDLLYRMAEIGFYCYGYRSDIIRKFGIRFDENTRHFEDREFNWLYLTHCQSAAFVGAPLYWYRIAENSATTRKVVQWRTDGLEAVQRISAYLKMMKCSFASQIDGYLFPRVIWANAKNYAIGGSKEAFRRLGREYDVKSCMKRTLKDADKLVALASALYLVHPMLFYYAIRLKA